MKYHHNLTQQHQDQLLAEIRALEKLYADAADFDAAHYDEPPKDYCDEQEELRKAALNMGQP
jgi:hypothetical protein